MKVATILLIFVLVFTVSSLTAQDLSFFEQIDYQSVGLTNVPFSKRGECLVDIDRNGWADIYTLKYSNNGYSHLYTNNGGQFTDITDQTPIEQIESAAGIRSFNMVFADYDNDGDKDLSLSTNKAIHLLRNDNNVFTDVSAAMGFVGQKPGGFINVWHYSILGWADYDSDGDLDCLIYQLSNPNMYLFRNDGDHFTDVAEDAGLYGSALSIDDFINPGVWTDWDMDGDPDIVGRHDFFANEGGVFRDVTEEIGFGDVAYTHHHEFFDYDNDGDLDYINVTGRADDSEHQLWQNQDGFYVNVSQDVGLSVVQDRFRGVSTADFDNDGDQDVFMQLNLPESYDVLLVNDVIEPGVRAFTDIAEFVGLSVRDDRIGGGFFDYNNDGFKDIYIPSVTHDHILYRNAGDNGGNWVGFRLEGTVSNRDAVGSFVKLYYANGVQLRYTKAGSGFLRMDNPFIHFGIGFETTIDSVVIRWPLGKMQTLTDVAINQYHDIVEPDEVAVENSNTSITTPVSFHLGQNYPNPFNPVTNIAFDISETGDVNLIVYDMQGREVATLVNGHHNAGHHELSWNGKDDIGNIVSSGVYLYKLKSGNNVESKKMVFMQ